MKNMRYKSYTSFCKASQIDEYYDAYNGGSFKLISLPNFEFPEEFTTKKAAWEHYQKHFQTIDNNNYCGYITD